MNLLQGVMRLIGVNSGEDNDACLKFTCLEYIKNFYNDHEFKIDTYQPLLPGVIKVASDMLFDTQQKLNVEATNEVLELFNFVVDKYAACQLLMENQTTLPVHLVQIFAAMFDKNIELFGSYTGDAEEFSEVYGEQSILVQNILRIMLHLVCVRI